MRVLALTGGIASGKSTVARMFAELGAIIIDADKVAHQTYAPGTPLNLAIQKKFGEELAGPGGQIDRKALAGIVFKDIEAKKWLEQHTHGATRQAIAEAISKLREQNPPLVLVEAALHVETGYHQDFEGLIVVHVDPATQLKRLMARDQITETEAEARVRNQMPLDEKLKHAQWVIDNSQELKQTQAQVQKLFEKLTS